MKRVFIAIDGLLNPLVRDDCMLALVETRCCDCLPNELASVSHRHILQEIRTPPLASEPRP